MARRASRTASAVSRVGSIIHPLVLRNLQQRASIAELMQINVDLG
jgi:hypothetical protein